MNDKNQYVHYGAGLTVGKSWRNFDASPTVRIQRIPIAGSLLLRLAGKSAFPAEIEYGDIVKGLPLPPGSVRAVYCSHVLEHLAYEDCLVALRNTHQLLVAGGVFRLVLPDLYHYIESYQEGGAISFMEQTGLGIKQRPRGLVGHLSILFGNKEHLWMWDFESLKDQLESAGFHSVRRAAFGDSSDTVFSEVENEGRWHNALGIECVK